MIKSLLLSALLALSPLSVLKADEDPIKACSAQLPFGTPGINWYTVQPVCHTAYISFYDHTAKSPKLVSYVLTVEHATGCTPRTNNFHTDSMLDEKDQATPKDYNHSGYDKGHISPAEDNSWSYATEQDSFSMINMSPQLPSFNRGIWKHLEDNVRNWTVYRNESLTVYAGPIYNTLTDKKFSGDNIDIPTGFFKIVVDNSSQEAISFKFDDQSLANGDSLESHIVSVADVEAVTGISFPVPKDVDKTAKSEMWPFTKGEFQKQKLKECKK